MRLLKKTILITVLLTPVFLLIAAGPVLAQTLEPSVFSGGSSELSKAFRSPGGELLPEYIRAVYRVGVGLVVVLAVVVMMWGGLQWIMAGGNVSRIENAKSLIYGSVLGLVIALSSFVLLNTINPQLVTPRISAPNEIVSADLNNLCCYESVDGIFENNKIHAFSSFTPTCESISTKFKSAPPGTCKITHEAGGFCYGQADCKRNECKGVKVSETHTRYWFLQCDGNKCKEKNDVFSPSVDNEQTRFIKQQCGNVN